MLKWTMDSKYKISMWGFYKNVFLVFYYFHNTKNKLISVTEYVYVCCMETDTELCSCICNGYRKTAPQSDIV